MLGRMIEWMKSNYVEYEHIKKRAYDRDEWRLGSLDLPEKAEHSTDREESPRSNHLQSMVKISSAIFCKVQTNR